MGNIIKGKMYFKLGLCIGLHLLIVIGSTYSAKAQTKSGYCELAGSNFQSDALKYVGPCMNNTANGWGKLYLRDGNIATALFKGNKIQNEHIDLYRANLNEIVFGQNMGMQLNGPCMSVNYQNMVGLKNFENGNSTGNAWDYFKIPKPDTSGVVGFCDSNGYNVKTGKLVPGTENVIYASHKEYNSNGDKKYWITIVNLKTNKVVKTFGSLEKPLELNGNGPEFIGFALPNYAIYKYSDKLHQLDMGLGTNQVISAIPADLNNALKFKEKTKETNYKDFVSSPKLKVKIEVLRDSSYVKIFNNSIYNESVFRFKPVYGSGASVVKFNKNHEIIESIDLTDVNIYDFAINEQLGRIALSYKSADSTFLSYLDLNSLNLISTVFSKGNVEFDKVIKTPGAVRFSNSGAYLLYDRGGRGTSVYLGNELYFGVSGVVYGFNNDENIILSNQEGQITAFDLEKKAIIWSFYVRDNFLNTGFFCFEKEICIISGNPLGKSGIRLNRFIMPEPMLSLNNFIKNSLYDARNVGDTKKVSAQNKIENSKTNSNQVGSGSEKSYKSEMVEDLANLFLNALLEGFSGGTDTQPNRQNNDQKYSRCTECGKDLTIPSSRKCSWCGRSFEGWGLYRSIDYSDHSYTLLEENEKRVGLFGCCIPSLNLHECRDWTHMNEVYCSPKCGHHK
jgi:hypothetical protein